MSTISDRSSAVETRLSSSFLLLVYVNAFITGAVVMGFEMLGSRYLNPFFGSGIYTWAALISTVLAALTAGYFFGGWMADRKPTPAGLGWLIVGGSAYLAVIPLFADGLLDALTTLLGGLADQREFERWGSIAGAMLLLFVPLALLGVYSPYAIRLTLRATTRSGTVAGRIYGISTLGSIFGTLFVTFYLIPAMGSRHITYLLAAIGVAAGVSFLPCARAAARRAAPAALAIGALTMALALAAPRAALAEAPSPEAKEAAERFLGYLKKHGVEVREATIEAGPGPTGFRIVNFVFVGDKTEAKVASFEAGSFAEAANGEATLTNVTALEIEARGQKQDKSSVKIARFTAENLTWNATARTPRFMLRALAVRDIVANPPTGETVRVASVDAGLVRLNGNEGGAIERFAIRTVTFDGPDGNGSIGSFDIESIVVEVPSRSTVKGMALRDVVVNLGARGGTVRLGAFELRELDANTTAYLSALDLAIKDFEAPLSGGRDPEFEREMRALGYTVLKLNAALAYRFDEINKLYDLSKLEIDIADAASLFVALKVVGLTPEEIVRLLRPQPRQPQQPPGSRQADFAVAVLSKLNLASADLRYRDKSLLGRVVKREAERRQTDPAAIRAQYKAMLAGLRDQQADALVKEALDAVIAFIDDPGEIVIEVRPKTPVSLMVLSALAASNPGQLREMLGIKITTKKP
jgi:hypothetical protein